MPASALCGAAAVARGEHVQGERKRFEAEEQHDEVVRRRHDHAADRGDQVQGVDLGPVVRCAAQRLVGQQRHEQQGDADRDRQEHRQRVEGDRAADERGRPVVGDVVPLHHGERSRRAGGDGTEHRVPAVGPLRGERAEQHDAEGAGEQREHRRQGEPADLRAHERVELREHQSPAPSVESPSVSPDSDTTPIWIFGTGCT